MKVFVMTDLEGVSGVVARPCTDGRLGHEIVNQQAAGALLTEELNACADGLVAGGATEIVAVDGHGQSNSLVHSILHPRVSASSLAGVVSPRSLGLGPDCAAAVQLGVHAMNGRVGCLTHTYSAGALAEMRLNGEPIGEVGIVILLAAYFGVPTALVAGDAAGCREAQEFIGFEIPTVVTKSTPWRYTVINRPIPEVRAELTAKAEAALRMLPKIPAKVMKPPFELTVRWMSINTADDCEKRGAERLDNETVRWCGRDFLEVWAQERGWGAGVHSRKYPELHAACVWK